MIIQEAKENMISLWTYLKNNPDKNKNDYAKEVNEDILNWSHLCPLCEWTRSNNLSCRSCPLDIVSGGQGCICQGQPYLVWLGSKDLNIRSVAANRIVQISQDWEIIEECTK